jgi:hypothetical protein
MNESKTNIRNSISNLLKLSKMSAFNFIVLCVFRVAITGNVSGIAAVGEFENRQPNICTKVDSSTTVQLLPSAPIAAIPC